MKKDINITNIEVYGYEPKENEQNEDKLYQITNIPLIVVNTEGKINYNKKTEKAPCNIIIIINGKISIKQTGTINIRGNSSKSLDKNPFRITVFLILEHLTDILFDPILDMFYFLQR